MVLFFNSKSLCVELENGVDAGPVGDSTRSLYKKKLAQVLR